MKQAALFDGFAFDPFPLQCDDVGAPEVDGGVGEVAGALVVSAVVVVLDEGRDPPFEFPWHVMVGVSVTSPAFIVVHSFQAMMEREKSSSTVDG